MALPPFPEPSQRGDPLGPGHRIPSRFVKGHLSTWDMIQWLVSPGLIRAVSAFGLLVVICYLATLVDDTCTTGVVN